MSERPVAIEVRDLHKGFRIPRYETRTVKERLAHPLRNRGYRELKVLEGISFDVHQGEFFGVVGRNGSGKSTLLKLIASIYKADSGRIRVAGRLAPFIELGVGFNTDLTAYDNVVLNGVMMGLTPTEARRRCEEVVEFAGLEDFTDLRMKNYSSGMRVRLAFAVMVQVDADVLLIDEVLAVGDAEFQAKCFDTFTRMRGEGRTIVLVTHSMPSVTSFCHRAMLIDDGGIAMLGDPEPIAARYTEINFERRSVKPGSKRSVIDEAPEPDRATVTEAWLEGPDGHRTAAIEPRVPIELRAEIEVHDEIPDLRFGFEVRTKRGGKLFAPRATPVSGRAQGVRTGERLRVTATIENPLAPGQFRINCGVFRRGQGGAEIAVSRAAVIEFSVAGPRTEGLTKLEHEVSFEREVASEVTVR